MEAKPEIVSGAEHPSYDVCIVGAGPAGLNAALILGRCGRKVIVYDSGQPRNAASQGLHGFLTRDGIHPRDLRQMGRDEIAKYPSVRFTDVQVAMVHRHDDGFDIVTAEGHATKARKLLLATGRIDVLPEKPGFREFYGRGVYHCPYCDGWEQRNKRIAIYGACPDVVDFALTLLTWTRTLTLCPTDPCSVIERDRARLEANGVKIAASAVREVKGAEGRLTEIAFEDGSAEPCDALFFTSALPQKSALAQSLGCELDEGGSVVCQAHAATGVPGLYVAGNVRGGVHLAIMAAAEGAEAAIAINEALADAELQRTADGEPAIRRSSSAPEPASPRRKDERGRAAARESHLRAGERVSPPAQRRQERVPTVAAIIAVAHAQREPGSLSGVATWRLRQIVRCFAGAPTSPTGG